MTRRVLGRRLDALAHALRRISRSTTRLRRSLAVDAQTVVHLEGAVDGVIRSLRQRRRTRQTDA